MFGLMTIPFYPNDEDMKLLALKARGHTNKEIADHFGITEDLVRWRLQQLRLNLGVNNTAQLMYEYRGYVERQKQELEEV